MISTMNNLKTVLLLGALFGLVVWVGSYWGTGGMLVAGVLATVMNFGAWFASDKIAIAAMRGRQVDETTAPDLVRMVARLAERANLPMPRVYVCPQDAPNAFATGRNPKHAAVAVTRGALQLLAPEELEGVMAHELAHVKNRDTLTSTIAATVAGLFAMLSNIMMYSFMLGGNRRDGAHPLVLLGTVLLGSIGAALIRAMISRSREFVADADGARIAGSAHGLMSALQKLDTYAKRIPMRNPNPAMNNLFIVEPFMGRTLTNLFATHPPTAARVAALQQQARAIAGGR
ncbi:MAG: M48 family metalloprotease [Phycisphaerales bacterium]|nr:M48 family metalloprotease [Phycisphaerales bacterium]